MMENIARLLCIITDNVAWKNDNSKSSGLCINENRACLVLYITRILTMSYGKEGRDCPLFSSHTPFTAT